MTTEEAPGPARRRPQAGLRGRSRRRGGHPLPRPSGPARPAWGVLALLGLGAYSWMAAGMAPFSGKALASVLIPGAVIGVIAYGYPPERIPSPDRVDITGFSYWVICIAALLEWEASAFRDDSRPWHPSLTGLITPLIQPHPVRTGAFLLWLLAGWALVRR
jgi:hypothetical protein